MNMNKQNKNIIKKVESLLTKKLERNELLCIANKLQLIAYKMELQSNNDVNIFDDLLTDPEYKITNDGKQELAIVLDRLSTKIDGDIGNLTNIFKRSIQNCIDDYGLKAEHGMIKLKLNPDVWGSRLSKKKKYYTGLLECIAKEILTAAKCKTKIISKIHVKQAIFDLYGNSLN